VTSRASWRIIRVGPRRVATRRTRGIAVLTRGASTVSISRASAWAGVGRPRRTIARAVTRARASRGASRGSRGTRTGHVLRRNLSRRREQTLEVLDGVSHLCQLHQVAVQLPLVAHGLVVPPHLLILGDCGDQGTVFIQHFLSLSRGGGRGGAPAMRRSIGLTRRSSIGLGSLGARSAAIGGGWWLLGPRGSRWRRLGGYTGHWQH